MASLHIVILGGASIRNPKAEEKGEYPDIPGFVPDPVAIEHARESAKRRGFQLSIHFVGNEYNYANRIVNRMESFKSPSIVDDAVKIESMKGEIHVCSPFKFPKKISDGNDPVIYISFNMASNSYEIMSLVESYQTNHRAFICQTSESEPIDYAKMVDEFFNLPQKGQYIQGIPYNFFISDAPSRDNLFQDLMSALSQIQRGCQIMRRYIECGFTNKEVKDTIFGWMLNPETDILKGIIYTYGLFPESSDKTPFLEVVENSTYRYQLSELLARIIWDFATQWGFMVGKDYNDWKNPQPYVIIEQRIKTHIENIIRDKKFPID